MKIIVAEADYHSGHLGGLTPPQYMTRNKKWYKVESELWETREEIIDEVGTPDLLLIDGDLIDGRGPKTGGTQLLTTSLATQAGMAAECALRWKSPKVMIARGTDYHSNWGGEDWEDITAKEIRTGLQRLFGDNARVEIEDQLFLTVDGVTFDVKHHCGSSSTPYTLGTSILKDKMWNENWYLDGKGQPLADIVLRAHTHIHEGYWGIRNGRVWYAIRMPALRAALDHFGKRVAYRNDWGLVVIKVDDGEIEDVRSHIVNVVANRAKVIKI